jgi:L-fuconolactonase
MKLDAHQHFWHFDPVRDAWITEGSMSAIRRDFLPDDLNPMLSKNGFDGCIAVQADLADKHDCIKGVVGWVDLKANDLSEKLDNYKSFTKLKGFRHILQGEKQIFMLSPKFIEGVRLLGEKGYTYDILVFPNQLKAVHHLLNRLDNQPLVMDHLAKPYIKNGLIKEWAKDIRVVAKHKNVLCKISGMVTEADWQGWKASDFTPYLDVIFDAFGTDRIMYGSDWPVCLVAADYDKQLSIVAQYMSKYDDAEVGKIFGGNAARFYSIL